MSLTRERAMLSDWVDRFLGSDPGLLRLRSAIQTVTTIGVAMVAESLFVHVTHALQIDTHGATLPPAQAAEVAAQHHALLIIAIMLGAVVGMIGSFTGALFTTPRSLLGGLGLMPVPMVAGLWVGLVLAPHRTIALASLAVVLAGGAYLRRFGPLGFVGGMLLFMGDFFGFFLHGAVVVSDIGWLAAEIAIGTAVGIAAQFTVFYPSRRSALRRMQTSFAARSRQVAATALDLLALRTEKAASSRLSRRMHRQLIRLNETALMIDAQLGDPAAIPTGWSAARLHQRVFDAELAVTNMARFAEALAEFSFPAEILTQVRTALRAVVERNPEQADAAGRYLLRLPRSPDLGEDSARGQRLIRRFAISAQGYASAGFREPGTEPESETTGASFEPSAVLFGGWLPGSAMVSATASLEAGDGWVGRVKLAPYARIAIQMAVAVTGAIVAGSALSERRFYWAVIAAFVTFMGANNAGEQLRKGFFRVAGTVVGVFIGAVVAHVVGQRTGIAIAVILVALFIGLYLMRISYAFMVIGITVMVSELYVQLDEFSDSLLVLRLEETAIGAGIAALTVLCVLPLHTRRVARVAAREYLVALASAVSSAVESIKHDDPTVDLRSMARGVDSAYQALLSVVVPRRRPFTTVGDSQRVQYLHSVSASRHYIRNVLTEADGSGDGWLTAKGKRELTKAGEALIASIGEVVSALDDREHDRSRRTYTRAAALFDAILIDDHARNASADADLEAGAAARQRLALRDLQLLDGALAALAQTTGATVRALDVPEPIAG